MTITDIVPFENKRVLNWFGRLATVVKHRQMVRQKQLSLEEAVRELEGLDDYQLADIGLTRSDLTIEGLATAAEKRARQQSRLEQAHTWDKAGV